MPALPIKLYRNPEETMIDLEEGTCAGCRYDRTIRMFGQLHAYCALRKRHGWKCARYEPAEPE